MNNLQNRAGQSTRERAKERYRNRAWFTLLTVGGILLILLVTYNLKSFGIGEIGAVGVWVTARLTVNYSDARTERMIHEEKSAILESRGDERY